MTDAQPLRAAWRTQSGFLFAALGAVIGLGNIWRFSYIVGDSGGGAFLLVYVATVLAVGLPVVLAELAMGRAAQREAASAFHVLARGRLWRHVGLPGVLASYVILTYYGLISGWALKYFAAFAGGGFPAEPGAAGGYFAAFTAAPVEPIIWQAAVMLAAAGIVIGGIERGIERASKFLMPVLAVIVVALAVHSLLLPDARRGLAFLFGPDWSALAEPRVYLAALGQVFFSLGLAMGVLITYGSYLPGHFPLPRAALTIVAGDTLFALVVAVVIFPAVFSFGMSPDQGPGLAFVTLPEIFARMSGGIAVGVMFFGLLVLAAMTSLVALIEIPTAYAIERWRLARPQAVALVVGSAFLLGVPSSLGFGLWSEVRIVGAAILDGVDFLASSALLPASGLAIALFAGWHWARADAEAATGLAVPWLARLWWLSIRYLAPATIALVLLRSLGAI